MKVSHKLLTILICLIFVLAGALTLIFYFSFKPKPIDANPVAVEDIVVCEGKEVEIVFEKASDGAKVTFATVDESVAIVKDNKSVYGVKEGVTILNISVEINGNKYFSIAQIKVVKGDDNKTDPIDPDFDPGIVVKSFYYDILPLVSCELVGDKLIVDGTALFEVVLYENSAKTIVKDFDKLNIVCSDGVTASRELAGSILISASKAGFLEFTFPELDFSITIEVVVGNV